jgi:putative FmdB family regulatory protein
LPFYDYEHTEGICRLGKVFEIRQSMHDKPFVTCPECRQPVKRLVSLAGISSPKTNSELRDLGFTKLVKRDDGVYENVTARNNESRYMEKGKPDTMPDISKIISD